jgi:hypothetical protein
MTYGTKQTEEAWALLERDDLATDQVGSAASVRLYGFTVTAELSSLPHACSTETRNGPSDDEHVH